jgi:hypothetical protein
MDVVHYGERFEKRTDPWGRAYYWATGKPPPPLGQQETDLTAIAKGSITLTPLDYNMTKRPALNEMEAWQIRVDDVAADGDEDDTSGASRPVVRTARRKRSHQGDTHA